MDKRPFDKELSNLLEETFTNLLDQKSSLQEALEISDVEMQNQYEAAYGLYHEKDFQAARAAFTRLVTLNPWSFAYWMGLGASAQFEKDFEQALRAYALAALLEKEDPYPHYHAAQCLVKQNNREDALKALNLALERTREDPLRHLSLIKRIRALKQQAEV